VFWCLELRDALKYIAKASAQLGHPTFILVRAATLDSSKKELLDSFTAAGITILHVLDTWNYPWFFFFNIYIQQGYSYF
jgi:hypothetical protein